MSFGKKVSDMRRRMELLNQGNDSFEEAKEMMAGGDLLGAREQIRAAKQMYRLAKNPSKLEEIAEFEEEIDGDYQDNPFPARWDAGCPGCGEIIEKGESAEFYNRFGDEAFKDQWVIHNKQSCIDAALARPEGFDPTCETHGSMSLKSGAYGLYWQCNERTGSGYCNEKAPRGQGKWKKYPPKTKPRKPKTSSTASFDKDDLLERARDTFRRRQAQGALSTDELEDYSDLGARLKSEGKLPRLALKRFMDYLERCERASTTSPPSAPTPPSDPTPPRRSGPWKNKYGNGIPGPSNQRARGTASFDFNCFVCGERVTRGTPTGLWRNNAVNQWTHLKCVNEQRIATRDSTCQVCMEPIIAGDSAIYPYRDVGVHNRNHIYVHEGCATEELVVPPVPERFQSFRPSPHQEQVRDTYLNTDSHMIVEAKAGSGKSTTLEWLILTTYSLPVKKVLLTAFNKSIARELQGRLFFGEGMPVPGASASTLNSHGWGLVRRAYKGKISVESNKISLLAQTFFPFKEEDQHKLMAEGFRGDALKERVKRNRTLVKLLQKTIDKIKVNLTPLDQHQQLVERYKIPVDDLDDKDLKIFYEIIPQLLDLNVRAIESDEVFGRKVADFNDQIYLAVVERYQRESGEKLLPDSATSLLQEIKYEQAEVDVLFVDETQDLNRAQQTMALYTVGERGRLVAVGDRFQSIYGFSGADYRSMDRLFELLNETDRGCDIEQLSVTFRCPQAVVEEAQRVLARNVINEQGYPIPLLNPEEHETILGPPGIPMGEVRRLPESSIYDPSPDNPYKLTIEKDCMPRVVKGKAHVPTMILSRRNAPLIGMALRLIAAKIPAKIVGRDISKTLKDYVDEINPGKKRNKNTDTRKLLSALNERLRKIHQKERKLIDRAELDEDRVDTDSPFALEKDQAAAICIILCGSDSWASGEPDEDGQTVPGQCAPDCDLAVGTVEELKDTINNLFNGGHCPEDHMHVENKRNMIQDRGDTYCPVCMDGKRTDGISTQVEIDKGEHAVTLSSIHKSKGLEALQIYILQPESLGNLTRGGEDLPEEDQRQELHMEYVAVTRTKYLKGDPNSGILTYLDDVIDTPASAPPPIAPPAVKPPTHPTAAPTSAGDTEEGYSFWKDEDCTIPLTRGELGAKKRPDDQIIYKDKEKVISILESIRAGRRPKYKGPAYVYPDPEEATVHDLLDLVGDDE